DATARRRNSAAGWRPPGERRASIYPSSVSPEALLDQKRGEFGRLRRDSPAAVPAESNNAFLVSIALYTDLVPAFERLLAASGGDLPEFYRRAGKLGAMPKNERPLALAPR